MGYNDRSNKRHDGTCRFKVLSNCRMHNRAQCLWKPSYLSLQVLTRHMKNAPKPPGLSSIVDRSCICKYDVFQQELQIGCFGFFMLFFCCCCLVWVLVFVLVWLFLERMSRGRSCHYYISY